jgi:hypothetical protein
MHGKTTMKILYFSCKLPDVVNMSVKTMLHFCKQTVATNAQTTLFLKPDIRSSGQISLIRITLHFCDRLLYQLHHPSVLGKSVTIHILVTFHISLFCGQNEIAYRYGCRQGIYQHMLGII